MNEQRSTILVVEDDRCTRTFLADNLAADGYEPIPAETAREAVRLMETRYPDLAILDLTLPDRDGLELLAQVREADGIASRLDPGLPVLVLTGRAGELHRLRAFERGADGILQKPYSYPELKGSFSSTARIAGVGSFKKQRWAILSLGATLPAGSHRLLGAHRLRSATCGVSRTGESQAPPRLPG